MLILWGIEPFLLQFSEDMESTVEDALRILLERSWVNPGDSLVFVSNVFARNRLVDTIQLRKAGES